MTTEETRINRSFLRRVIDIVRAPLLWLGILLGTAGIVGGRFFMVWQRDRQIVESAVQHSPSPSPSLAPLASLQPPTLATVGTVSQVSGDVTKTDRDTSEPAPLQIGDLLRDGDTIETAEGAATIDIPEMVTFRLGAQTKVAPINLLPGKLVFRQTTGDVSWEVSEPAGISIRTTRVLLDVTPGSYQIIFNERDPKQFVVRVASGSAQLGMVNAENKTQVWEIAAPQTAEVNETKRTVTVQAKALEAPLPRTR
jgi:hypothetical protein